MAKIKNRDKPFWNCSGGKFKDLRIESARCSFDLQFDSFGIGGEFGDR